MSIESRTAHAFLFCHQPIGVLRVQNGFRFFCLTRTSIVAGDILNDVKSFRQPDGTASNPAGVHIPECRSAENLSSKQSSSVYESTIMRHEIPFPLPNADIYGLQRLVYGRKTHSRFRVIGSGDADVMNVQPCFIERHRFLRSCLTDPRHDL